MPTTSCKRNKWLFWIAKGLAIVPSCSYDLGSDKKSCFCQFYGWFMFCFITAFFGVSFYGRIVYIFPKMSKSLPILDGIYYFSEYIVNMFTLIILNFLGFQKTQKYFHSLEYINKKFASINFYQSKDDEITKISVFIHLYFLFVILYELFIVMIPGGASHTYFFLFEYFQRYHIQITILVAYQILNAIKNRLAWLNRAIINIGKEKTAVTIRIVEISLGNEGKSLNDSTKYTTKIIIGLYGKICDCLELFNRIFGCIILVVIINTIAMILAAINFIILFVKYNNEKGQNGNYVGVMLNWMILALVSNIGSNF